MRERVTVPGDLPRLKERVEHIGRHAAADVQHQWPGHHEGQGNTQTRGRREFRQRDPPVYGPLIGMRLRSGHDPCSLRNLLSPTSGMVRIK